MKRVLGTFLVSGVAACLFVAASVAGNAPATGPAPGSAPTDKRPVHKVKTAEEFVAALGPDRIIEMAPGEYVLSKVKRGKSANFRWAEAIEGEYELVVRKVPNLAIRCLGEKPAHIITEHSYAFVLNFEEAPGLELANLKMGHSPDVGYCTGGVVKASKCKGLTIDRCVLYGCGTVGLELKEVSGLAFSRSVIEDCTYGILTAEDCEDLRFAQATFRNNCKFDGFDFTACTGVAFKDCVIRDNCFGGFTKAPIFKVSLQTDDAKVRFTGGEIVDNGVIGLCNEANMVVLKDVKVAGNSWQAPEGVVKLRGTKVALPEGGWTYYTSFGETDLFGVAISVYGNGKNDDLLKKANPGLPETIRPDTKIVCPAPPEKPK